MVVHVVKHVWLYRCICVDVRGCIREDVNVRWCMCVCIRVVVSLPVGMAGSDLWMAGARE